MSGVEKTFKVPAEFVKSMMIDFVVHDMNSTQLMQKYNLTQQLCIAVIREYKFREKRMTYKNKLLDKALDRLAYRQANILNAVTLILEKQVKRLMKQQAHDPDKLIDSNRMKELIATYAIVTKEHRLNNDQATDNTSLSISVTMGSDIPIVTDNHLGTYEAEGKPIQEAPAELNPIDQGKVPTKEEIEVIVEASSQDTEESGDDDVSNDMFGSLD